ncbi:MAG: 1-acyl-sn-glycerol-3-phosphate acyltransferase [Cytophagales bacterium CG12_big_fil_rev_8_21_14_0_65_40_12]|nr:MAG: 1-acyl-sn-glycerol-3-phosphate acyltransferase [Cytophagales bacterium CG12_big_fil_rev_8_21_14_0_65_40_12]PIW05117.1 MAG: 1-acyl-sn-glycerol-3-phosphate acyltransferase [Cytophagales bacterium CG17_big_fil_post_rev_8_21_14_2_50_40_13]
MIRKIAQVLFTSWAAFWFVAIMIAFSPFTVIPRLISPKLMKFSYFFARVWVFMWSYISFIRFKTHGRNLIQKGQPYIFTISHTSFLDAPAIPMASPVPLKGLGKKELAKIPIFGFVASTFAVWVDRSSEESRKKSVEKLVANLKNGVSIMVAPEGTRNDSADPLLPFFNGPFRLAIETGMPIMPLIIYNAKRLMPKGQLGLKPGTIYNYFLPAIPTENLTMDDLPALKEQVYEKMKLKIMQLDQQNKH